MRLFDHFVTQVFGREIGVVLPPYCVKDGRDFEVFERVKIPEWLKNRTPKRIGEIHSSFLAIAKSDSNTVSVEIFCFCDFKHRHLFQWRYSIQRLMLLSELPVFNELLNWQIELVRRYGEPGFSLLGVRFVNMQETFAQLGELRGHALLDGLVERLQETIRETDRCSRSSEELLWMLLPRTNAEGLVRLQERLLNGARLLQGDDVSQLELRLAGFTAPADLEAQETAELLLARLTGQIS